MNSLNLLFLVLKSLFVAFGCLIRITAVIFLVHNSHYSLLAQCLNGPLTMLLLYLRATYLITFSPLEVIV